jgi:hypothetical protein
MLFLKDSIDLATMRYPLKSLTRQVRLMLAEKDSPQIVPNGNCRATEVHRRESNRVVLDNYIFLNPPVNCRVKKKPRGIPP